MPNPNGGRPGHAEPVCDFGRFLSLRVCCANGIPGKNRNVNYRDWVFLARLHCSRSRCPEPDSLRGRLVLPGASGNASGQASLHASFSASALARAWLRCSGGGPSRHAPFTGVPLQHVIRISLVPRASHGQGSCRRGPRRNASSQQTAGVERIASPRQFVGTASVLFPTLTRGIAAICHTSPCRLLDLPQPTQRNPMPPRKTRRGS